MRLFHEQKNTSVCQTHLWKTLTSRVNEDWQRHWHCVSMKRKTLTSRVNEEKNTDNERQWRENHWHRKSMKRKTLTSIVSLHAAGTPRGAAKQTDTFSTALVPLTPTTPTPVSGPNSKHWFTTSFLGGRCRKAMLGVRQSPERFTFSQLERHKYILR